MSNFEEICLLSCEKWVDSFPDDIPKHKFSEKHEKIMKPLLACQPRDNERRLSGKIIRFIIIAAVIMAVAATVFAIPSSREFIIKKFSGRTQYSVTETENNQKVESLDIGYIPAGFEKTYEYDYDYFYKYGYENINGKEHFDVDKHGLNAAINYDSRFDSEEIYVNGAKGVYFSAENGDKAIVFNNGEYVYTISGDIEKEELIKIAQNVK